VDLFFTAVAAVMLYLHSLRDFARDVTKLGGESLRRWLAPGHREPFLRRVDRSRRRRAGAILVGGELCHDGPGRAEGHADAPGLDGDDRSQHRHDGHRLADSL
jgi:hypothetical protein